MNNNKYQIEIDHLALGLTRSPMFMGVNIRLFFANVVVCTLICIDAHTFWGVVVFIVLHLLMVRLSVKDANFFYVRYKTFTKTPPLLNRAFWGKTNSYGPW